MCTEIGMFFWLVGGVLYDLRDKNDRMLGFPALQAEWMADSIRDNILEPILCGKTSYLSLTGKHLLCVARQPIRFAL
jgi:hypothetical protein